MSNMFKWVEVRNVQIKRERKEAEGKEKEVRTMTK